MIKTGKNKIVKVKSTFKGWYTEPDGKGQRICSASGYRYKYYTSYGDTLYANWNNKYVINYEANGGHFGSKETETWKQRYVFQNRKYPRPSEPRMSQYRFIGWYDSKEGGNKVEVGSKGHIVTGDTTLYAHWEKVEFDFNVTDITTRGWTMSVTPKSDLSRYSIRFQYSESPKGTVGAKVYTAYNGSNLSKIIKNKPVGTTYYVWAYVERYRDKVFSTDVKTVTTKDLEFTFEVNNQTENGWTQKLTLLNDVTSGYTIRYKNSLSPRSQGKTTWTNNTTNVTGKEAGTKYYVWVEITRNGKTIYADREITTVEQKLEFRINVNVTSTEYTKWTQNITVTSGNVDGYAIKYRISQISQNDQNPEEKNGSRTGTTTISGREEGKTYYVWGEATKSGKTFKSTNYAVVNMGHVHKGSSSKGGNCYESSPSYQCGAGASKLVARFGDSVREYKSTSKNTYCFGCGRSIPKGTYSQFQGHYSSNYTTIYCLSCEGSFMTTSYGWVCATCETNPGTAVTSGGTVITHAIPLKGYYYTNHLGRTQNFSETYISRLHKKLYALDCTKPERQTSVIYY